MSFYDNIAKKTADVVTEDDISKYLFSNDKIVNNDRGLTVDVELGLNDNTDVQSGIEFE